MVIGSGCLSRGVALMPMSHTHLPGSGEGGKCVGDSGLTVAPIMVKWVSIIAECPPGHSGREEVHGSFIIFLRGPICLSSSKMMSDPYPILLRLLAALGTTAGWLLPVMLCSGGGPGRSISARLVHLLCSLPSPQT